MDTTGTEDTAEQRTLLYQSRRARNSHALSSLFEQRDDLSGISQMADFFVDSVRWTA